MRKRQVVAGLLASALVLSDVPLTAFAQEVGVGDASATSNFDTSDYFDDSLIVMIPDEVSLTLNEETQKFEGSGFVTAWGKAAASTVLSVSTDAEITYKNTKKESITVNAGVAFGENLTGTWSGATLNSNINADTKAGYDVVVSASLDEVDDIGTYTSVIPFNISVGRNDTFTYYMGYKYTTVTSYTDDDGSIRYEVLPSGDTVAELQAFSTDKQALIDAGYDKIVASTDSSLEIPSQIDGLDVVGVSFNSFFADEEISSYVTNVVVPSSVEGIELTDNVSSTSQTVIDAYNYRTSVKLSKSIPNDAKIRFIFQDTEMFIYTETTYNGVEGYTCFGFSDYGLSVLDDATGRTVTIIIPDTYKDKPVIAIDFENSGTPNGGSPFDLALSGVEYDDVELICGNNILYIEGAWNSSNLTNTLVSKITAIQLNDGVLEIQNDAFKNNSSLKTINFPASLTKLGTSAFANATSLEKVVFEEGFNAEISDAVFYNTGLREVTLPSSVTNIRSNMFMDSPVSVIHFNNNSADVSVNDFHPENNWCVYLDFLDNDYVNYANNAEFAFTGNVDEDYNFHISDDTALAGLGSEAYRALKHHKDNIILDEGITTLGVSLRDCSVTLPSSLTSITVGGALSGSTLSGNTDFRGVALNGGYILNNVKAENLTIFSSLFDSDVNGENLKITNLYIQYDTNCSSWQYTDFSNIQNIYFSGSEDEWASFSEKLVNISSFTGTIQYNQTF